MKHVLDKNDKFYENALHIHKVWKKSSAESMNH